MWLPTPPSCQHSTQTAARAGQSLSQCVSRLSVASNACGGIQGSSVLVSRCTSSSQVALPCPGVPTFAAHSASVVALAALQATGLCTCGGRCTLSYDVLGTQPRNLRLYQYLLGAIKCQNPPLIPLRSTYQGLKWGWDKQQPKTLGALLCVAAEHYLEFWSEYKTTKSN
jgi:hypothetical protein